MTDKKLLQALVDNPRESLEIELKNWLGGLKTTSERAKLAKEIIALGNSGGGWIVIGFDDCPPHAPLPPGPGEQEAFSQDSISEIVHKYITPPCQCNVDIIQQTAEGSPHPIISVPGKHRTPLFAAKGAPDSEILQSGTVYVRRPGGYSEPARSQDDWEKLIDRLVVARQSEQLDAIRSILAPVSPSKSEEKRSQDFDDWIDQSFAGWRKKVDQLSNTDPRRLDTGFWYVAFDISNFEAPSLAELQGAVRDLPRYSYRPPFFTSYKTGEEPKPRKDLIEAFVGSSIEYVDGLQFWRLSRNGQAFIVRPFEEDRADYGSTVSPPPRRPALDWTLPIFRHFETLSTIIGLTQKYGASDSVYQYSVTYVGMQDRTLFSRPLEYHLDRKGPCQEAILKNEISGLVGELDVGINEAVLSLLKPIYEQFEFAVLEPWLVNDVIKKAKSNRP